MVGLTNLKYCVLGISLTFIVNVFADTTYLTPYPMHFVLSTTPSLKISRSSAAAATVVILGASSSIHFLQTTFYSSTLGGSCNTSSILGTASITDNDNGFPFTDGQPVTLNSQSAYALATSIGINPTDVRCLRLYMDGGNLDPDGIDSTDFTDEICFGNTCISSQVYNVTWKSDPNRG